MKQEPAYPTADRFRFLKAVLRDRELTKGEKLVVIYIIMVHFNDHTGQCDPSVPTIAKGVGMTERGVRTCLNAIKDRGWLEYEDNPGGYRSQTNNYMYCEPPEPLKGASGVNPCTTVQGSARKTPPTPEKNDTSPCTTIQVTPEKTGTGPLNGGSAKQLTEQLREHSLEQVRSLARTAPMPTSEGLKEGNGSKVESKGTSEGSKPKPIIRIDAIENGTLWLAVADYATKCEALAAYDDLLAKLKAKHPGKQIERLKIYVSRNGLPAETIQ